MQKDIEFLIEKLCNKWQLANIRPLVQTSLTNNYVAVAYSAIYNCDVVLKILIADTHERQALELFNGNGCVKLLDYDDEQKGLLLEYITPGISLKTLFPVDDIKALEVTAQVIKKLQENNPITRASGFKTVNQWLDLLSKSKSKKIPAFLLHRAIKLSNELLSSKQESYLLHGDLHHENILRSCDGWIAIDPKGVIGPLEYEVGRFIMNPIPDLLKQQNAKEIIQTRVDKFSEIFDFEKQRLIDWVFVQAVLSACWVKEGGDDEFFEYFVKFARLVLDV